ncbi:protein Spindly-like [Cylas formicarius]|uniref:protein Spindly-like n=1 Tax=Cylas formicarius TaxID=197179 RepID=UPI00295842B5|nr:protein Spindly-like [Cylas formicarius]
MKTQNPLKPVFQVVNMEKQTGNCDNSPNFSRLQKELEDVRQELYDTNRQLKLKEAMLLEYQQETERLQTGEQRQLAKFESKIASLEETIVTLRDNHERAVSTLESEIARNEETITKLKNEIDVLKNLNETDSSFRFNEELANLETQHEELQQIFDGLKNEYITLSEQHKILETKFDALAEENSQLNETLKVKREELAENLVLIEKLNEELACANLELGTLKNQPLDTQSKGNSLFAEVDDRRVHLQHTVNNIKSDYTRLKFENSKQEKLIMELKKQNVDLCEKWKKDLTQVEEDQQTISVTLNDTINLLKESLEKLKKELAAKHKEFGVSDLPADFRFYMNQVELKQKEIRHLEQKLMDRSLNTGSLSMLLAQANKETRKWRLEALKLKQVISKEKEVELPSSVPNFERTKYVTVRKKVDFPIVEQRESSSNVIDIEGTKLLEVPSAGDKVAENNNQAGKENVDRDAAKKGVTFCESTVEPSSQPARRRAPTRVFIAKPFSENN